MREDNAIPENRIFTSHSRRSFFAYFSMVGLSATAFPSILLALAQQKGIVDVETISKAEELAGLSFDDKERDMMLRGLNGAINDYENIRELRITNETPPAFLFNPYPIGKIVEDESSVPLPPDPVREKPVKKPVSDDELAFLSVSDLGKLIRRKSISSTYLTQIYIDRLKKFDKQLKCVVTLMEDDALRNAAQADKEISAGEYRGPLHGIPWGAKDLFSVKGYPTTWGAMPYKDQIIDEDATVVTRLKEAGAVLVAKLSLGALAMGDVWFEGKTKNPWNVKQGSSGSSAGPAAAVAAGLLGFALGTETCGSIVSPCARCGATGLRPTFGRVSRHGAMALSWTMDKVGPICRTARDCALVFEAIQGPDANDPTVLDKGFWWQGGIDPKKVRIGYPEGLFKGVTGRGSERMKTIYNDFVDILKSLGFKLVQFELPEFPVRSLYMILRVEAASAFDELTRSNMDDDLTRQDRNAWPNIFRTARMIPAVEYIQANRARQLLMQKMDRAMEDVDLYICPSFGGDNLIRTNLTGHPAVVLPIGFMENGSPASITFNGSLFCEETLLCAAHAYQQATAFHMKHPAINEGG